MPVTPPQTLKVTIARLKHCVPILNWFGRQLDANWAGSNATLARCEDEINDVRALVSQTCDRLERFESELSELKDIEDDLAKRAIACKTDLTKSQDHAKQLEVRLSQATHRCDKLQQQNELMGDDLKYTQRRYAESEQTIGELKTQLATANIRIEALNTALAAATWHAPPLPNHLAPGSPGIHARTSADSGFSSGSNDPADHTRQTIASGLLDNANIEFDRGDYKKANAAFDAVEVMIDQLPASSRQGFDITALAYRRAICCAESGADVEAETKLKLFLKSHNECSRQQKADITHLLARTYVKLGRLDTALDHSCIAVGIWHDTDQSCNQYFNAIALLMRIFSLQGEPLKAVAVVNQCPESWKEYVGNKYFNLRPSVSRTNERMSPTQPIVPQPRTAGRRRPGLQVPNATRPPVSTAGSTVSGTTNVSTASTRAERYKKLPLLFRIALT
ncbi:hypothetical protein LTR17_019729 [Elasticomyces elasticus]|nr:hypothetical protein LTR17_019729 [Elasticomyces elasticus]